MLGGIGGLSPLTRQGRLDGAGTAAAARNAQDGGPLPPIPRLYVREAALLNSLSRLMAAVPLVEARILGWTAEAWRACREAAAASAAASALAPGLQRPGEAAAAAAAAAAFEDPAAYGLPPLPPAHSGNYCYGGGYYGQQTAAAAAAAVSPDDDVAPQVGAQFAQAVKELRSEYALAVRAAAARLSAAVASRAPTSVAAVLTAVWRDASAAAAAQLAGQHAAAAAARAANAPYAAAPSVEARMFGAAQIGGLLHPGQAAALPGGGGVGGQQQYQAQQQQQQGGGGGAQASAHRALVERAAGPLLVALAGTLAALAEALEPRALVAVARALWDDQARALLAYAEALQEGNGGGGGGGGAAGSAGAGGAAFGGGLGGAWRARQHCSALLALLDAFFRDALVSVAGGRGGAGAGVGGAGGGGGGGGFAQGGELTDRDLAAPVHSDAAARLLASSSTALNMAYTPV
jgi:hypothetical protein